MYHSGVSIASLKGVILGLGHSAYTKAFAKGTMAFTERQTAFSLYSGDTA